MEKLWNLISEQSLQYIVYLGLSVIVFILAIITYFSDSSSFQRYFGRLNPVLVLFFVILLGLMLFSYLLSVGHFAIFQPGNLKGLLLALVLPLPFAAIIILVDRMSPFPINMNIPYPDSLTFYPVMGFVVEIVFHILPFSIAYFVLSKFLGTESHPTIIWISILVVALIEPIFQVAFMIGQDPSWKIFYVGLHIYLFSLVQLLLFTRYDFISMYVFRLSYYLMWHVIWGHMRLNLLF